MDHERGRNGRQKQAFYGESESSTSEIEEDEVAAGRVRKDELKGAGHWVAGHQTYAGAREREKHERAEEALNGVGESDRSCTESRSSAW